MAEKRMFSKKIIDTDWFMDMPATTQNLYFHLSMRADDDGFIANPRRIIKLIGASDDDYKLLIAKHYIIPFDSGVCVITDWRINNYLRNDRYTETIYQEEKSLLKLKDDKYELGIPSGIPQVSLEYSNSNSNSLLYNNIEEEKEDKNVKHKHGEYKHVLLTDKELEKLVADYGDAETQDAIKYLDEYIEMKGVSYKNHNLVLRKWVFDAVKEHGIKSEINKSSKKPIAREYSKQDLDSLFTNLDDVEL